MSKREKVQLVDCPRDAIQGIKNFIPTAQKIAYINQLVASEFFDFIDFGSFVSAKAVPQMADTAAVLDGIDKKNSKLIAIIANEKGAEIGSQHQAIDYLGYPFSVSETFQKRNTNKNSLEAFQAVETAKNTLAQAGSQELMVYLSMAFGNPYGDLWHTDLILDWMEKLSAIGIRKFSLADTTAEATPALVQEIFTLVKKNFPELELSIHLHSRVENSLIKVKAAYEAGCRIFEGAIMGYGGCPFAQDDLVGNIPSEILVRQFIDPQTEAIEALLYGFQSLIKA